MEVDNEVLDWGNEEEEQHYDSPSNAPPMEDADDAVSLGDEDDEQAFYTQQYPEKANNTPSSAKSVDSDSGGRSGLTVSQELSVDQLSQSQQECQQQEDKNDSLSGATSQSHTSNQKDSPKRSQPLLQPRLTHALPPKPIASTLPYISPSHPSIVEATAMSARARDHKRTTGSGDHYKEQLPPDWEIRYPRSGGRTFYYYNAVTHQSTWCLPGFPPPNRPKSGPNSSKLPPANNYGSSGLSYDDRHYRPGSPDIRHEDRVHNGSDLGPAERGYTPPKSPHLLGRARSASPVSVPVTQHQSSAELRGRTRSSHSYRNTDAKREFSDLARDRDILLVDSESRWAPSSKGGHASREARHMQHSSVGMIEHAGPTVEDRPMISRSYSARGRNRECESMHSSVEGRQDHNHSQNLSASRHHSPPPHHDREWIPAQRDQRGSDFVQQPGITPAKVESNLRSTPISAAPRRDRPSRFDQPSAITTLPTIITGPPITTQRSYSHSRPRERDVYVPDDTSVPYQRPAERDRERDFLTTLQQVPIDDGKSVYIDDRPTTDHRPDWQQAVPVNSEYAVSASDQPGPSSRRRRVPLPPQATSFRKDSTRKKDHELPRHPVTRPLSAQTSVSFPTESRELQRANATSPKLPLYGPRDAAPRARANSDVERRRPPSVSGPQYDDGTGRERTISTEYRASGSSYLLAQAHTPADVPMDVDNFPTSSSRAPPAPLPDIGNDPIKLLPSRLSAPSVPPSTDTYLSRSADNKGREEVRTSPIEPHNRQGHIPRSQRAIYDGTDRHVSRELRGHPSDLHRPGPAGYVPKLTGPNSVPIGTRRQMGPGHEPGSRLPEAVPPPLQSPIRNLKPLPPLPPGKESYERPVFDVKTTVDSYKTTQQDVGSSQRRQRNSPPLHKRNYPFEPPSPAITSPKEGRRDIRARERSRFDQPSREGRVPQSYERPVPDPPIRQPHESGPPREASDRNYADWQPSKPVVEPQEPLKSPRALLLAAKEKLEKFAEEDRLRRQEQQKAQTGGNLQPKPLSAGSPSVEEERQKTVEQEISHLRIQEAKSNPEEHRLSRPLSPSRLLANKEPLPPVRSEHKEVPQRQEYNHLPDIVRKERSVDGQKQSHPITALPAERNYSPHSQRPSERTRPADVAPVNAPPPPLPPDERRTRWGEPLQIVGASEAERMSAERLDGRGQGPGQVDKYEPNYGDGLSRAPHRQRRPQPRPVKGQPAESSRLSETPQVREYEKAHPRPRPLLDRLSLDTRQMSPNEPPSLWDRVQIPEKRDRNEMDHDYSADTYEVEAVGGVGEPVVKKARRRGNKPRRSRRGGVAP